MISKSFEVIGDRIVDRIPGKFGLMWLLKMVESFLLHH